MSAQTKQLYRSRTNRMLAGVAGGLGEYFDIDPTLVRLLFVFGFFFFGIPGTLALIYLVLAIVVPEAPETYHSVVSSPAAPVSPSPADEPPAGQHVDEPIDPAI